MRGPHDLGKAPSLIEGSGCLDTCHFYLQLQPFPTPMPGPLETLYRPPPLGGAAGRGARSATRLALGSAFTLASGVYSRLPGLSEPRLLQAHSSSLFLLLAGSTATWVSPRSQRPAARAGEPCSSLFSWLHPEVRFTGGGLLGCAPGNTARYGRGATQAGWECPESPQPAVTSTLPLLLLLLRWDSPAGCSGVSILHQEHL